MSNNIKPLTPFKLCVIDNFPFIEADFDAITNYQLLCKVVEYLNKTISSQNEVIGVTNEIVEAYNYIINYFNNLDLQKEVDNKLDEMAEDGTLQEIIADYLNSKAIFGFDSVSEMLASTNLINGSYAKTLGYYNKNDGGMTLYKISSSTSAGDVYETLNNGLYAIAIFENEINPIQFGCYGDNTHDDSEKLQKCIDYGIANKKLINGLDKSYLVSDYSTVSINKGIKIDGDLTINNIKLKLKDNSPELTTCLLININNTQSVNLNNIVINGNRENQAAHSTQYQDGGRHGIRFYGNGKLTINNAIIYDCYTDGIALLPGTNKVVCNNIEIYNAGRNGITDNSNESEFNNIYIHNNGLSLNPRSGYHIEPDETVTMKAHIIKNSRLLANTGDDVFIHFNENGQHLNIMQIENSELKSYGSSLNIPADENDDNFVDELLLNNCTFSNNVIFGPVTNSQLCGYKNIKIDNCIFNGEIDFRNYYNCNLSLKNSTLNKMLFHYCKFNYLYIDNCNFIRATMPSTDTQADCGLIGTNAEAGITRGIIKDSIFNNLSRGIRARNINDVLITGCKFNVLGGCITLFSIINKLTLTSNICSGYRVATGDDGQIIAIGNDNRGITDSSDYSSGFTITQNSNLT